jgi:hypothetical protein
VHSYIQVEENFKQAELKRIKEERAKRLADKQREEDLKKIAVSTLHSLCFTEYNSVADP